MATPALQRCTALAGAAALSVTLASAAGAQGTVGVMLNGRTLNLSPAPTERAGRVFVPLRGVFENLGASVVYSGGVINATGRGHSVSLRIGSQQATVDGQQQTIDVAPFIIGASTYVPLRFVSQALGAGVNWDNTNRVVAITANGAPGNYNAPPPSDVITPAPGAAGGQFGPITLASELPARGATVSSRRPTIEATFAGGAADPASLHVMVDGTDVTNDSTRSPRGFAFAPRSPLQAGSHRVRVTGNDRNGNAFARAWSFNSGTSEATVNQIVNVSPQDGSTVPNQFVVSGRTSPNARVTVQVGATNQNTTVGGLIGAILGAGNGQNSVVYNLTADPNGRFSAQVNIGAPSGSTLGLVITATDPQTGASATPVRETLQVR
jgi:hypothetical protein